MASTEGGSDHRLLDRHRPRDGGAARRERALDGLRDRAPARVDRRPRGQGLPHARARRHRRGLDAGRGGGGRAGRGRGRCARSTTPATARAARWRRCRSTTCAPSSRRTSSGSCGCASSCCRACAARGYGKIVNISSMGGKLVFPGGGAYHATKFAVEAISDAMRFEVAGFGVDVVLIEPGLITTEFGDDREGADRRRGRPLRGVQHRRGRDDGGDLREPGAPPRRRPGRGRQGDREGDRQAAARARATRSPPRRA